MMIGKFGKIVLFIKRVAIVCSLSLAVFAGSFYLVNLDFSPVRKLSDKVETAPEVQNDEELKQRLGSSDISFADFSDWMRINDLSGTSAYDADPDGDDLPNYLEYIHGTDPNKADTDGDKFSDSQEINNGYDPDAPGDTKPLVFLRVDKINVEAPMIWSLSTDENKMLTELEKGVSHFFKTAAPGQAGNAVISGHSSNYLWAKGDYNHIFKDLNDLVPGDAITMKTMQKNGRIIVYHYKIADKFVTAPDDERIFASGPNQVLTLSTCWPLGTNFKRLIVQAELVK